MIGTTTPGIGGSPRLADQNSRPLDVTELPRGAAREAIDGDGRAADQTKASAFATRHQLDATARQRQGRCRQGSVIVDRKRQPVRPLVCDEDKITAAQAQSHLMSGQGRG